MNFDDLLKKINFDLEDHLERESRNYANYSREMDQNINKLFSEFRYHSNSFFSNLFNHPNHFTGFSESELINFSNRLISFSDFSSINVFGLANNILNTPLIKNYDSLSDFADALYLLNQSKYLNSDLFIDTLNHNHVKTLEEVIQIASIKLDDYNLTCIKGSGVWGTVYEALHSNRKFVIKIPNENVDTSSKNNQKIISNFAAMSEQYTFLDAIRPNEELFNSCKHDIPFDINKTQLDFALDEIMKEEARIAAFLSDEENENLIIEKGKYIPIASYHGSRSVNINNKIRIANIYSNLGGNTLRDILDSSTTLDIGSFLEIMSELSFAIKFLNDNGYSHNDLKPDNIFYNARLGQVKLIDLAFAKSTDYSGSMIGKRVYTDPNRLLEEHKEIYKADIYSFGCIMYESLIGNVPYTLEQVVSGDLPKRIVHPKFIQNSRPDVRYEIANIISNCLTQHIDARPNYDQLYTLLSNLKNDYFKKLEPKKEELLSGFFEEINETRSIEDRRMLIEYLSKKFKV